MRYLYLYLLLLLSGCHGTLAQVEHSPRALEESQMQLLRTLTYYFHGFELNDVEALSRAYHEQAQFVMVDVAQGTYEQMQVGEYFSAIFQHPPKTYQRHLDIEDLEITGNVASVHTTITFEGLGQRIHDFLLLLRAEGAWQIIHRSSFKEYANFEEVPLREHRMYQREANRLRRQIKSCSHQRYQAPQQYLASFIPGASVSFVDTRLDRTTRWTLDRYRELLGQSTDRGPRRVKVLAVEVFSKVAIAKVQVWVPAYRCSLVEYWSLVREGSQWQVVHKASYKPPEALAVLP